MNQKLRKTYLQDIFITFVPRDCHLTSFWICFCYAQSMGGMTSATWPLSRLKTHNMKKSDFKRRKWRYLRRTADCSTRLWTALIVAGKIRACPEPTASARFASRVHELFSRERLRPITQFALCSQANWKWKWRTSKTSFIWRRPLNVSLIPVLHHCGYYVKLNF